MIPGINILGCALQLIASEEVQYFADAGRVKQANGVYLTNYAAPVPIDMCSVQAVDRAKYTTLGLDLQKTYITWYVPALAITTVARAKSGDVIEWDGGRYQLNGGIDWTGQDNWGTGVAALIGPATGALTNA
jgi:hypothetical protein